MMALLKKHPLGFFDFFDKNSLFIRLLVNQAFNPSTQTLIVFIFLMACKFRKDKARNIYLMLYKFIDWKGINERSENEKE